MTDRIRFISGRDLAVGDVIYTLAGNDTIVGFRPYIGTLFPDGARIARFAHRGEMTIPDDDGIVVYVLEGGGQ
jgi:hypothetical protein